MCLYVITVYHTGYILWYVYDNISFCLWFLILFRYKILSGFDYYYLKFNDLSMFVYYHDLVFRQSVENRNSSASHANIYFVWEVKCPSF